MQISGMPLPPRLAAAAASQGGPFTAAQARSAGLDERELSRLFRSGRVVRLRRGVYAESSIVPADEPARHILTVRAALLRLGGPVAVSHVSGAAVRQIELLHPDHSLVHVTRDGVGSSHTEAGVRHHVAALPPSHLTKAGGLVVTSAARTVVDLARTTGYVQGLVAIESALRQGLTTRAELRELGTYCADWPGSRNAGRAIAFASPYSETVGETLGRISFDLLGLPEPEQQVSIFDDDGLIARVDYWWKQFFTVGEFDGRIKYAGPLAEGDTLIKEKYREDRLRDAGAETFRFGWNEALSCAPSIRRKALAAFERGSRPGVRRSLRWVSPPPRS